MRILGVDAPEISGRGSREEPAEHGAAAFALTRKSQAARPDKTNQTVSSWGWVMKPESPAPAEHGHAENKKKERIFQEKSKQGRVADREDFEELEEPQDVEVRGRLGGSARSVGSPNKGRPA